MLKAAGRPMRPSDLPTDVVRSSRGTSAADAGEPTRPRPSRTHSQAEELAALMLKQRRVVLVGGLPDLHVARSDARPICARSSRSASRRTNGNYRLLVQLFNMPADDYKRFLSFLRKHDCHLPFQRFRAVPARLPVHRPAAIAKA